MQAEESGMAETPNASGLLSLRPLQIATAGVGL